MWRLLLAELLCLPLSILPVLRSSFWGIAGRMDEMKLLGGGFRYFSVSPLPGEMMAIWQIFFKWVEPPTRSCFWEIWISSRPLLNIDNLEHFDWMWRTVTFSWYFYVYIFSVYVSKFRMLSIQAAEMVFKIKDQRSKDVFLSSGNRRCLLLWHVFTHIYIYTYM